MHQPSSCPRSIGHESVHLPDFCASMSPQVHRRERRPGCGCRYGFLTFEPTLRTTSRAFSNHLTDGGTRTRCTYASGDVGDVQSSPFTAAPPPPLPSCQPHSQTPKSLAPEAVLMPQWPLSPLPRSPAQGHHRCATLWCTFAPLTYRMCSADAAFCFFTIIATKAAGLCSHMPLDSGVDKYHIDVDI